MKLKITCNAEQIRQLFTELQKAPKSESTKHVLQLFLDSRDFVNELFTVKTNNSAATAGELLITLEPTDFFRRISAAVLAGDVDSLIVEHERFLSGVQMKNQLIAKDLDSVTGHESS